MVNNVVFALSTAKGSGCLAIIRASGDNVFSVGDCFIKLKSGLLLDQAIASKIYLGKIIELLDSSFDESASRIVDVVTAIIYKAPHSFTGENSIEIICHNNELIISEIMNLFVKNGAQFAGPGEFSQRAFLNGKLDLLQAEAIHEVIVAKNQETLKRSLLQLDGSLSFFLEDISATLIKSIAFLEAYFEFQEEDSLDINLDKLIENNIFELIKNVKILYESIEQQEKIRSGIKIGIIGSTNVGKSTLFNSLLKKNRAIVCDIPGTTRDVIEAQIGKNGIEWALLDTAGIRSTDDKIEKIGIEKSLTKIIESDVLLLVVDGSAEINSFEKEFYFNILEKQKEKTLLVINKIDKKLFAETLAWIKSLSVDEIFVSSETGENIVNLELKIDLKIKEIMREEAAPFLLNKRQSLLITELFYDLKKIESDFVNKMPLEIVVIKLRTSLDKINIMTGKNMQEEVLSQVFSSFCIGK